jgi:hypothetical protein
MEGTNHGLHGLHGPRGGRMGLGGTFVLALAHLLPAGEQIGRFESLPRGFQRAGLTLQLTTYFLLGLRGYRCAASALATSTPLDRV